MSFLTSIISKLTRLFFKNEKQTQKPCSDETAKGTKTAEVIYDHIERSPENADISSISKSNVDIVFDKHNMKRNRDVRRFIQRYQYVGEEKLREYIPLLEDNKLVEVFNKELDRIFLPDKRINYDTNWKYDESERPPFLSDEEYKALGGNTNKERRINKEHRVKRPIIYHIPMGGSTKWKRR